MNKRPKLSRVEQEERAKVRQGMYQPRDRKRERANVYVMFGLLVLMLVFGVYAYVKLANTPQDDSQDIPASPEISSSGAIVPTASPTPDMAADFTVYDGEGNAVSLSQFRGKGVVLNFWASWCSPCQAEMPYFQEASEAYGEEIVFMMVNLSDGLRETQEIAEEFLQDAGYTFPVYYDLEGEAAAAYGVRSIPHTVWIDGQGAVVGKHTGSMSREQVQAAVDALLDQQ